MGRFSEIFPELDEIPGREFTPAETGRVAGVFPEIQRLWRFRLQKANLSLPEAPYDWNQVMQWAVTGELAGGGLAPADAWQIASSAELRKAHDYDFRNFDKPPLFVFYRPVKGRAWEVLTRGDKFTFDPSDPYWGRQFHAFNYSVMQRCVVEAYERIRN